MRLLERDASLATLRALQAEATSFGGRLVFIEGEPPGRLATTRPLRRHSRSSAR